MKKKNLKYELPEFADEIFNPEDLMSVLIERNGCKYFWGIPYKNFKSPQFQNLEEPYKEEDLLALGGKLLDILIVKKYEIDFKQSIGVRKLDVVVRSSEIEDQRLLHKVTSEFRKVSHPLDRDSIPGTGSKEHDE